MLDRGDIAPDFVLQDQDGRSMRLSDLLDDGPVVLFFYPADFTPVCTREACAFRDRHQVLAQRGTQIVGISPQDVPTHRRFSDTFSLPFPLLCDTRKRVIRDYGVDGPLGFGVRRATYLISPSGIIEKRAVSELFLSGHLALVEEALAADWS